MRRAGRLMLLSCYLMPHYFIIAQWAERTALPCTRCLINCLAALIEDQAIKFRDFPERGSLDKARSAADKGGRLDRVGSFYLMARRKPKSQLFMISVIGVLS